MGIPFKYTIMLIIFDSEEQVFQSLPLINKLPTCMPYQFNSSTKLMAQNCGIFQDKCVPKTWQVTSTYTWHNYITHFSYSALQANFNECAETVQQFYLFWAHIQLCANLACMICVIH